MGGQDVQGEAGRRTVSAAMVVLVLLAGVWAVWAWQYGAWFGTTLYPGTVVLAAGLVLLALFAPVSVRLRGAPAVAVGALVALGAWSALSAFWSPAPDVAVEDAQRIFTYAMAFGLGIWLCALLGARIHLAPAPLAFAGLFAGAMALGGLLTGDDLRPLVDEGAFQYPIGYRNANAAFFLIATWAAVGLAASPAVDWRLRGLSLGTATLCVQLAVLSQSRGSIIAAALSLAVFVAVSKDRARSVIWLTLALIPAFIVVPAMTDLYEAARDVAPNGTLPEIRAAGDAVALGTGLALVAGLLTAWLERRYPPPEAALRRANRLVGVGAIGVVVVGLAGFVIATGDPVEWVGDRADEFRSRGTPAASEQSSRFGFNAGTERDDIWRVALEDAKDDPALGAGAGSFYYSYLKRRSGEGVESARDAHSVELEVLGELGVPGLVALALALGGAAVGAVRARSLGPGAAGLSACALTVGVYWLAHASIDWFWGFPALVAPVLALLGAAAAPTLTATRSAERGRGRWLIVAAACALVLSVVSPYLSAKYVDHAFDTWESDTTRAFDDLDRAASLNPLAEEPYLAKGGIAREAGENAIAIEAFEDAARKRPEDWVSHYFLATLLAEQDPERARAELDIAAEQNPLSPRIQAMEARLERVSHRPSTP